MTADAWAAWAQWVTALIAAGAAIFAYQQVKLARETRERVAQPDVVAYIDHNPNNWHYLDLVIRNYGQSAAYNVKLILPSLKVVPYTNENTGEKVTDLYFPKNIAVLAPGQEWRTVWDSGIEREEYAEELESQFVGRVDFDDKMIAGNNYMNPIALDADMFRDMLRVQTFKAKSAEKALYEISATLRGYKQEHQGIWVYTVPGDQEKQYSQERAEAAKARSNVFAQKIAQAKARHARRTESD